MKEQIELMGHVVAGYPTMKLCVDVAVGILKGGANFLEVQFPFSDGNADGSLIQNASDYSIKHGFTPEYGFHIIKTLVDNTSKNILAMTYANIVVKYGIPNFVAELQKVGAYGLIVPDFIFQGEDFGLRKLCKDANIYFIELIAPLTPYDRIEEIAQCTNAPFLYVVARNGLTGMQTQIDDATLEYISQVNNICKKYHKDIMIGFGINNPQQIKLLENKVFGVVVGSHFIKILNENLHDDDLIKIFKNETKKLLCLE